MQTSILSIELVNDKLSFLIDDPGSQVSKIPGVVKIINLQYNGIMKRPDKALIDTKMAAIKQIRGKSLFAGLYKVRVDNPLDSRLTSILLANFKSGDMERVGSSSNGGGNTGGTTGGNTGGDTFDYFTPPAETGFKLNPLHVAIALLALLAIYWFYFKK